MRRHGQNKVRPHFRGHQINSHNYTLIITYKAYLEYTGFVKISSLQHIIDDNCCFNFILYFKELIWINGYVLQVYDMSYQDSFDKICTLHVCIKADEI